MKKEILRITGTITNKGEIKPVKLSLNDIWLLLKKSIQLKLKGKFLYFYSITHSRDRSYDWVVYEEM